MRWFLLLFLFAACEAKTHDVGSERAAGNSVQSAPAPIDRSDWPTTLKFGPTPGTNTSTSPEAYAEFAKYLEAKVGVKIEIVITKDYKDLTQRLISRELDFGDVSPLNYTKLKKTDPGVSLLARELLAGSASYSSYIVTLPTSPIKELADLRGRSMAFVDTRSTSGYLFPLAALLDAGMVDPLRELGPISYLGNHEAVIDAVLAGKVEAGAVWSGAIGEAMRRGRPAQSLFIVFKTERIPSDAFVARSGLPPSLCGVLSEALFELSTSTEAGRLALTPLPSQLNGFIPAGDKDYEGIREVVRKVEESLRDNPPPTLPAAR